MSKLLVTDTGSWYDALNIISFYSENDFEVEIANHLSTIFPDYIGIKFKFPFTSATSSGGKEPDLLIIKKDFSEWWITEVELSDHTISHIIGQISVFYRPTFNAYTLANYILKEVTVQYPTRGITFDDLYNMVQFVDPKVLVIIDEPKAKLATELKKYNTLLCILTVFKDTSGGPAYHLDGEYPRVVHRDSHCRLRKGGRATLEVITPDILDGFADRSDVILTIRRQKTLWRKVVSKGKTYLTFAGREIFPLSGKNGYVLEQLTDKSFHLSKRV